MFSDQNQSDVAVRTPPKPYSPVGVWAETYGYLIRHFGSILVAAIPALLVALVLGAALVNWMTGGQLIGLLSGQDPDPARAGVDPLTNPAAFTGGIFAVLGLLLLSFSMFAVPITRHIFADRRVTPLSGLSFNTVRYLIMTVLVGVVLLVIFFVVSLILFAPLMGVIFGDQGNDLENMNEIMIQMMILGIFMNVIFVLIVARFMFIPVASAV